MVSAVQSGKKTLHLICNTHEHNFKSLDIGIQNSAECIPVKILWTKSHVTFETFGFCVWHCWTNGFIYNAFVRRNINFRCSISRICPIFIGLLHFFSFLFSFIWTVLKNSHQMFLWLTLYYSYTCVDMHPCDFVCCDSTIAMRCVALVLRLFNFSQLYTIIANDETFFLNIQLQWHKRYNNKLNKQRYATALPMFLTAFSMIMLDNIIQTKPRKKWDKTKRKFVITTGTKIVQRKKKQISQNYRSSSA